MMMKKVYLVIVIVVVLGIIYNYFKRDERRPQDENVKCLEYTNRSSKGAVKLNLNMVDYYIDPIGWEVMVSSESDENLFYSMRKEDGDTSKFLTFFSDKDQQVQKIDSYTKEFYLGEIKHHVCMYEDTFYYYTENQFSEKVFIIGEYNFRFSNAQLSPDELGYYVLYRDSLGRIRGHNLPKLPPISEEEREKIKEIDSLNQLNNN
ncbi:MAG: hypothetical protein ABJF11_10715 [Reichenbachiella sp.]|uniref:hypothetical protein n=1 Tax=Reichenbachiella sp. TaxID=2184521 RepID=UPI0032671BFE